MSAPGFKAKLAPSAAPHEFAVRSQYTVRPEREAREASGERETGADAGLAAPRPEPVRRARRRGGGGGGAAAGADPVPAARLRGGAGGGGAAELRRQRGAARAGGVVRGRTSAQLPGGGGALGPEPAAGGLVVFVLGIQWNHPLGVLSPGGREMGRRFGEMHGVLGTSEWSGAGATSGTSLAFVYYFADVASIHAFAHEALHRAAWDWFKARGLAHVGIFHETYVVPAGGYETIYENCAPVGLGRSSVRCEGGGEGEGRPWVNTLVSADTPALRTHLARLGRGGGKGKV